MDGVKVLFSKFSGSEVKVGSESLLIMRTDDILAIWQGEKDGDFNV
jgi:co-chaperonin GroES (HSP10)